MNCYNLFDYDHDLQDYVFNQEQIKNLSNNDLTQIMNQPLLDSYHNTLLHALCYYNLELVPDYIQKSKLNDNEKLNILKETPLQIIIMQFKKHPETGSQAFKAICYQNKNIDFKSIMPMYSQEPVFLQHSLITCLSHYFYYLNQQQKQTVLDGLKINHDSNSLISWLFLEILNPNNITSNILSRINHETTKNTIQLFKQYGADLNQLNNTESNALLLFLKLSSQSHFPMDEQETIDIVQYFINEGLDVDHINRIGESCLHQVIRTQQVELIQFLIDCNADVDRKNNGGSNALMSACTHCIEAIDIILPHIKKINATNSMQENALICLCNNYSIFDHDNRYLIIRDLLIQGINPYRMDIKDKTVFNHLISDNLDKQHREKQSIAQFIHSFKQQDQLKESIDFDRYDDNHTQIL